MRRWTARRALAGAILPRLSFLAAATLGLPLPLPVLAHAGLADAQCVGDCDGDGSVTVDHLVLGVSIALGIGGLDACAAFDVNQDSKVTIDELIQGVRAALNGCPPTATPTPTPSPGLPATPTPNAAPEIEIVSPSHGSFIREDWVSVGGRVMPPGPAGAVFVNGVAIAVAADGTFTTRLPLDRNAIFNPILAELEIPGTERRARHRIVVAAGDWLDDGALAPQGIALRVNDSGVDHLEGLLPSQIHLDLESLLPPGTLLINNYCVIDSPFGCIQRVDVRSRSARFESIAADFDAMAGFLDGDVVVNGPSVTVNIRGGVIDCDATYTAERALIRGDYDLAPAVLDPGGVDVSLIGAPVVALTRFEQRFTSGVCNTDVIEDVLRLALNDLGPKVRDLLTDHLRDPDANGPLDSPVAAAIEGALGDFDFAARIVAALGIALQVPFLEIAEDADGVTFDAGTRVGMLPSPSLALPPGSYRIDETVPTLGANTPSGNHPYDLGLCISTTSLNQLLKAVLETGVLSIDLTELGFGSATVPITAGTLSVIIPEAGGLDPSLPITIRIRPTIPPLLDAGSGGALGELRIAQLDLQIVSATAGVPVTHLRVAIDARAGFDLQFTEASPGLQFLVSALHPADVTVTVLDNPLGTNEAELRSTLAVLVAQASMLLTESFGSFDLPAFFGLQLHGVEAAHAGTFRCLFFGLEPSSQ